MEASKYILSNIQPGEKLLRVLSSSKGLFTGWFQDVPDVALTDQRVFGRNADGKSHSFPASKIKTVEVRPDKGLLGREKSTGSVAIIGPYNRELIYRSENMTADRDFIMKALRLKFN